MYEKIPLNVTDAVARYSYATVPICPRAATTEQVATYRAAIERLFAGAPVLGIEVTDAAIAARCSLGNADPQHGCHMAPPNTDLSPWDPGNMGEPYFPAKATSAVLWAHNAWHVAPEGAMMITSRADLDSVCAMAVLALHSSGLVASWCLSEGAALARRRAVAERVYAVDAADNFSTAAEAWAPSPLPTAVAPWGDERGSLDSRRSLAAINAAVQDAAVPLSQRVEWAARWLLSGEEPSRCLTCGREGGPLDANSAGSDTLYCVAGCSHVGPDGREALVDYRVRVESTRRALVEQITPQSVRLTPGGIAIVGVDHPGAISLGYCRAPVVIARHPKTGKVTVAAWQPRYFDFAGLIEALNAAERDAGGTGGTWGGNPSTGIMGSPLGGTALTLDTVIGLVRQHRATFDLGAPAGETCWACGWDHESGTACPEHPTLAELPARERTALAAEYEGDAVDADRIRNQ